MGDGTRIKQIVNGETTRYRVDVSGQLPQVLEEQQGLHTTRYLYAAGMVGVEQDNSTWSYQHTDALGSVRQTTDAMGAVQQAIDFDPFGSVRHAVGQPSGTFGYAHEQHDAASGLIFLRARYYDPSMGRFLTRDTYPAYAPAPQSLHRYVYVENNPVNHTDPAGLMCIDDPGKSCHADRKAPQVKRPPRLPVTPPNRTRTAGGRNRYEDEEFGLGGAKAPRPTTSLGSDYADRHAAEMNQPTRTTATSMSRGDIRQADGSFTCTNCTIPTPGQRVESYAAMTVPYHTQAPDLIHASPSLQHSDPTIYDKYDFGKGLAQSIGAKLWEGFERGATLAVAQAGMQLSQDLGTVFSNAPLDERLGPAVRVGILGTLLSGAIVLTGGKALEAARSIAQAGLTALTETATGTAAAFKATYDLLRYGGGSVIPRLLTAGQVGWETCTASAGCFNLSLNVAGEFADAGLSNRPPQVSNVFVGATFDAMAGLPPGGTRLSDMESEAQATSAGMKLSAQGTPPNELMN